MTGLSLLLLAVSAAAVLAEPTVYFREQFEDGGEILNAIILSLCIFCGVAGWNREQILTVALHELQNP